VPSSWDLVAATSALSDARCTVVSFMFAHGKTKAQQENFTLERQQRILQLRAGRYFLSGRCRPASYLTCCGYAHKFFYGSTMQKRDLELLASTFEREWVHVHVPPAEVSGDQEFVQGYFQDVLRRHNIAFREQGAPRHNKTGVVERGNGVLKDFVKRLVLDIQSHVAGSATIVFIVPEVVSQATYFKDMIVGNKMLSACEQCRGYHHPCAAYTDASLPRNVSLHMTRWLHVELVARV
jgi:hypothetical protein